MIRALVAALLACLALSGCRREPPPPAPPARPALWVIDRAEGRPAGWLFGTIHALPRGTAWRTPALAHAVRDAGVLVVEVRDLDQRALAAQFARLARDRAGPPLALRLPPGARRELAALLDREGVAEGRFDALETWAAALALARLGEAASPREGVDRALLADFADRPVRELEGAAAQLAIFDALPEREQRDLLAAVIAEHARAGADRTALARAWLAGDTQRLARLARTGLLADPELYEALLAARNRAWMNRLTPLLERGERPLVAVGAAHLLGPDGLPAMLTARGYRVRRIQ